MRVLFWFLLVISVLFAVVSPAQETGSDTETDQSAMIVASIEFPQVYSNPADRLSQRLRKELDKVSGGQAPDIKFLEGPSDELKRWTANQSCRYLALIEITRHAWTIDHPFRFPFLFHVFRNNFKMEGSVKLYRRGYDKPVSYTHLTLPTN